MKSNMKMMSKNKSAWVKLLKNFIRRGKWPEITLVSAYHKICLTWKHTTKTKIRRLSIIRESTLPQVEILIIFITWMESRVFSRKVKRKTIFHRTVMSIADSKGNQVLHQSTIKLLWVIRLQNIANWGLGELRKTPKIIGEKRNN